MSRWRRSIAARRLDALPYLERLRDELDILIIYVSHAPEEVTRIADEAVALDRGRVVARAPLDVLPSEPSCRRRPISAWSTRSKRASSPSTKLTASRGLPIRRARY
jgi:ABC-type molybdate transport system ATPase subunit